MPRIDAGPSPRPKRKYKLPKTHRREAAQPRSYPAPRAGPPTPPAIKRAPEQARRNEIARQGIRRAISRKGPPTPDRRGRPDMGRAGQVRRQREEELARKVQRSALRLFRGSSNQQTRARTQLENLGVIERMREARAGPPTPEREPTPTRVGRSYLGSDRSDTIVDKVGGAVGDTFRFLKEGNETRARATPISAMGLTTPMPRIAEKLAARGIIAGGKGLLSALDRPSAAVESALGKALASDSPVVKALRGKVVGDIEDSTVKRRIQEARDPLEVFVKGRRDEDVSGGDIAEAVGLPKQTGIAIDLATDPLMYTGAGALRKGAHEAAAGLRARISQAPGGKAALRDDRVARAFERAETTGDAGPYLGILQKVAQEQGVSTRFVGRTHRERLAKRNKAQRIRDSRTEETRQILEDIRAGRAEAKAAGREYVPDLPGQQAVESIGRRIKQTEIQPGFRLRALTPFGREIGSIPVPLPKRLANKPIVPLMSGRGRDAIATQRLMRERFAEVEAHQAALSELRRQRIEHPEMKDTILKAEAELQASMRRRLMEAKGDTIDEAKGALFQTPDEITERVNRRKMLREVSPAANEFGRMIQTRFFQQVQRAIEDNLGPGTRPGMKDQLAKIQLHRFARADTGAQSVLKRAGIKLTPSEQAVMNRLDKIDEQMAKFGRTTGTLNRELEDYGGPRVWNPEGYSVEHIVQNLSGRMGSSSFFGRHRQSAAVSDMADPDRLAAEIKALSDNSLTDQQARRLADEWHDTGAVRMAQELMMRSGQRGLTELRMDQLPGTFQRAARLGEVEDTPLFRLDPEEGLSATVRLNRSEDAQRHYGLPSLEPGELDPQKALLSVLADKARVRHLLRTTKTKSKVWRDMKQYMKTLDNEATALQREVAASTHADVLNDLVEKGGSLDELRNMESALLRQLQESQGDKGEAELQDLLSEIRGDIYKLEEQMRLEAKGQEEFDLDQWDFDPEGMEVGRSDIAGQGRKLDSEISRILDDPRSGNPYDDVIGDVTTRLPDFRQTDAFPILDMRSSYFYRTRSEGVNAAFRTRWHGIDAAEGRAVDETDPQYITNEGEVGALHNLELMMFGGKESDEIVEVWYDRARDQIIQMDELSSMPPTLVPNGDRTMFWDIHTGREYTRPLYTSKQVGKSIDDVIQPRGKDGQTTFRRVWPTDVIRAADIEAKRGGDYDIMFKTGMESGVGKLLSLTRYSVTSLFPAYHTRNMISDLLKSVQADSGVLFHPIANAKMTALAFRQKKAGNITVKGLGTMDSQDFLLMADTFGLRSGHHVAEVARLADTGEFPERGRIAGAARALGPSGAVGSRAVDFGVRREDVARFLTFAQRMRSNGGDGADATMHMIRHHFNYNDLTLNERRIVRNLFLFYTWYRKNIPLQLVELAHRPGFFSGVAHTYNALEEGETPVNQDYSQIHPFFPDLSGEMPRRGTIPDYLQDRLQSTGVSWNGHAAMFGFGAPWADLSLLKPSSEGLRDFVAMLNPIATTGAQLAFKSDLLTGRSYYQQEATGASTVIDAVVKAMGMDGLDKDDQGRPILPWAATVILRNVIPGLGRSFGAFEGTPSTRDVGALQKWGKRLNALHGINVYVSPRPGSTREELAVTKRVEGRAAERREFLQNISNLDDKTRESKTRAWDLSTLLWAKEHGIPRRYLENVKQTGYYISRARPPAGTGLGGGRKGGGGLGGSGLGG